MNENNDSMKEDTRSGMRGGEYDMPGSRLGAERRMASNAVRAHEKREHRAKRRYYAQRHEKALETFARVNQAPIETRTEAIEAMARNLKFGSYRDVAELIFAVADFCWACNEMGEDSTLQDEASEQQEYEENY